MQSPVDRRPPSLGLPAPAASSSYSELFSTGAMTTRIATMYMKKRKVVVAPRSPYSEVDFSSFGTRKRPTTSWST